jgi:cation-transporting P-type ATPase E
MEPLRGLSSKEVAERVAQGRTNASGQHTSRSFGEILRANLLTRFNFLLGALLVVILAVGHPQDALFGIVLVTNALIGIVQEVRAKRTLDRLAVLNAPRASVVRDGTTQEVPLEAVVLDDLVVLRTGDQVVADGTIVEANGLQLDESLLTGESEPVDKEPGARTLSGSFVVAGSGSYRATAVGKDSYARQLTAEARQFTHVRSELIEGINRLLRYVTWAIPPATALLLFSQFHAGVDWREALTGTVAGLVAMVPQGLVLLTSIAFAVAAVTLARRRRLLRQDGHPHRWHDRLRPRREAFGGRSGGAGPDRAGRRREPQRHPQRPGRRLFRSLGLGADGERALFLGAQVERGEL